MLNDNLIKFFVCNRSNVYLKFLCRVNTGECTINFHKETESERILLGGGLKLHESIGAK